VEKLVYVVWTDPAEDPAALGARMRGDLATALRGHGARQLQMNLADEHVAAARKIRMAHTDPPVTGTVSFWLDCADDRESLEKALAGATTRLAGYLVAESVPLRDREHPVGPGERAFGTNMVALLEQPERLSWEAWIAHWHGPHKRVALEIQATWHYVRNVVLRPLTADAPPWKGIVEEVFADEAVTDPMQWYAADGDPELLKERLAAMLESVRAFLDVERVESHPTSRYCWDD